MMHEHCGRILREGDLEEEDDENGGLLTFFFLLLLLFSAKESQVFFVLGQIAKTQGRHGVNCYLLCAMRGWRSPFGPCLVFILAVFNVLRLTH